MVYPFVDEVPTVLLNGCIAVMKMVDMKRKKIRRKKGAQESLEDDLFPLVLFFFLFLFMFLF